MISSGGAGTYLIIALAPDVAFFGINAGTVRRALRFTAGAGAADGLTSRSSSFILALKFAAAAAAVCGEASDGA